MQEVIYFLIINLLNEPRAKNKVIIFIKLNFMFQEYLNDSK